MNAKEIDKNKGILLDARPLVSKKITELKERVEKLNKRPCLAIVRIGEDFASGKYVSNKIKRCQEVGIESKIIHLNENTEQKRNRNYHSIFKCRQKCNRDTFTIANTRSFRRGISY